MKIKNVSLYKKGQSRFSFNQIYFKEDVTPLYLQAFGSGSNRRLCCITMDLKFSELGDLGVCRRRHRIQCNGKCSQYFIGLFFSISFTLHRQILNGKKSISSPFVFKNQASSNTQVSQKSMLTGILSVSNGYNFTLRRLKLVYDDHRHHELFTKVG